MIDKKYCWMFGINIFIYLATNQRIREAYKTFLKDMWRKMIKRSPQIQNHNLTDTSAFWIGLRNLEKEDCNSRPAIS